MPAFSPGVEPVARFDDATRETTLMLDGCRGVYRADHLDDVRPAVDWAVARSREGAWIAGFIAYEAAPAFDDALAVHSDAAGPLAWFGAFDTDRGEWWYDVSSHHISRWTPDVAPTEYREAFASVHDAIRRGHTYQVNLTYPMHASFAGDPRSLYLRLLQSQHVEYAAYLDIGDRQILSVSPERFFAVEGRIITTRPMKGTRRRGRWHGEDVQLRTELERSDKDHAENLMIVDLIRNDVGRIATTGSVDVGGMFNVEPYSTVWQLTSEITAEMRSDVGLGDVFEALFPCGSVTGAPKASTMGIIADIENSPRGVYCGAVGFVPPGDGLDGASFNVAIRTAVIDPREGIATYGVGGGVTWDSDVDDEYGEALTKASVLASRAHVPGLFETIRWDDRWVLVDEHLDRLAWSAGLHGLPFDRDAALGLLAEAIGGATDPIRARLTLDREDGLSVDVTDASNRFTTGPGPAAGVVSVEIDFDPIDPSDGSLYVKTTDRLPYDVRRRRHPGCDDVLLTNLDGHITESTIANVAFLIDGRWVTPPVSDGLLPGVLRGRLLVEGLLEERSVSIGDAQAATGMALINSVRGWRPATLVGTAASLSVRNL